MSNRQNARAIFEYLVLFIIGLGMTINYGLATSQQIYKNQYKTTVSENIQYGEGEGMVGILSKDDQPRIGPESFSNDADGNVYICDGINRRIQVFNHNGGYRFTIPLLNEIIASDVAVDKFGRIYVYDIQGKLYQYDKEGEITGAIDVDNNRWRVRMPMHIVNDKIYIRTVEQEDILIGKVEKGLLFAPKSEEISLPLKKGINGLSGRRYFVRLFKLERGEIDIFNKSGSIIKSIEIPMKGIVSIIYLSEDKWGNFYIQAECFQSGRIVLAVYKYDFNGNYITTITLPDTDYSSWAIKLLSIDGNGKIYQFLPAKSSARLNIFYNEY